MLGKIHQNHHTFALFDPPKMGNLMTPGKCPAKKREITNQVDQFSIHHPILSILSEVSMNPVPCLFRKFQEGGKPWDSCNAYGPNQKTRIFHRRGTSNPLRSCFFAVPWKGKACERGSLIGWLGAAFFSERCLSWVQNQHRLRMT